MVCSDGQLTARRPQAIPTLSPAYAHWVTAVVTLSALLGATPSQGAAMASASGGMIAYDAYSTTSQILTAHPDGTGRRTVITNGSAPAWSPDGRWIAYVHDGAIWRIRPDGTGRRRI